MCNFKSFLFELNKNTKIPFKIILEDRTILVDYLKCSDYLVEEIFMENKKARLLVDKKFQKCVCLLKYSIENKYKEFYYKREELINNVLENKILLSEEINQTNLILKDFNALILILVEKDICEVLSALKQVYSKQEFTVMLYKEYILIVGTFDDIKEHSKGIKELINFDLYTNCYVSYSKFKGFEELKNFYKECEECLSLCKNYKLKEKPYSVEELLFERSIFNVNKNMKDKIYEEFKDKFRSFDNEFINTIQQFVSCDLNITRTAKSLYIHRNTLIYRLDKLQKDTGYDIRNFKQATIFMIAFLIWKEKRIK